MLAALGLVAVFAAVGGFRETVASHRAPGSAAARAGRGYVAVVATVATDVDVRETLLVCEAEVHSITLADGTSLPSNDRIQLRLMRARDSSVLAYGDRIEARGRLESPSSHSNPNEFDYPAYLARRDVYAVLTARRSDQWRKLEDSVAVADWLPRTAGACKDSLTGSLDRLLPRSESGLLTGIILGGRGDLPGPVVDDFVATGSVHILAASGMNVSMTAGLLLMLARLFRVSRRSAAVFILAGLAFYTIMSGACPSILRADLMASAFLLAPLLNREADMASSVSFAAIAILIVSPAAVFDAGFQLSFATVIAIVALMPLGAGLLDRVPKITTFESASINRWAARLLKAAVAAAMVSFAAQLGSMPLIAQFYNQVSFVSMPANALVLWPIAILMGLGFVAWPLSLIWVPGAKVIAFISSLLLSYMIGVVHAFAVIPRAVFHVRSPGWGWIAVYYTLLGWLVSRLRTRFATGPEADSA